MTLEVGETPAEMDFEKNRYPYSIVWTPVMASYSILFQVFGRGSKN